MGALECASKPALFPADIGMRLVNASAPDRVIVTVTAVTFTIIWTGVHDVSTPSNDARRDVIDAGPDMLEGVYHIYGRMSLASKG